MSGGSSGDLLPGLLGCGACLFFACGLATTEFGDFLSVTAVEAGFLDLEIAELLFVFEVDFEIE